MEFSGKYLAKMTKFDLKICSIPKLVNFTISRYSTHCKANQNHYLIEPIS